MFILMSYPQWSTERYLKSKKKLPNLLHSIDEEYYAHQFINNLFMKNLQLLYNY